MTITITEPGVYDMPAEDYHADPCPTPSLSSGMISDLLVAPAKCRFNSPRLNPHHQEEDKENRFSIGTVSHLMFLEPHLLAERVAVIPAQDWRTNAAKDARDKAKADGRTPILAHQFARVQDARAAFLSNRFAAQAFEAGFFERSMFWRHPVHGFWCRARADFIAESGRHLCDYKATANANPHDFGRHAYQMGYHRRAAWYLEGAEIVLGMRPDHYWFINQETSEPYLTSVVELDMASIEAGQMENERAAHLFERALRTADWHGYRHPSNPDADRAFQVSLPTYAHIQIEERGA